MALGAPVTCLSLSPGRDLLATTHANRRGIFLWSNQLMFGEATAVALNAPQPLSVGLPSVATGTRRDGERGVFAAVDADELPSDSDEFYGGGGSSSSEDEETGGEEGGAPRKGANSAAAEVADAAASPAVYERTDAAGGGAPAPLAPQLVTLSLLPRAQWETLLHLDAIKARSRPIQPPKKPDAAPFFLPTVPGLEGNPVFDTAPAATADAAAEAPQANGTAGALAGWGEGSGSDGEVGGGGGSGSDEDEPGHSGRQGKHAAIVRAAPGSRVVRSNPAAADAPVGSFLRLLRSSASAGDFAPFMALVRSLSPAALDRELRGMVLLEGCGAREVDDVALLLAALEAEIEGARNYEFAQALLQHVLAVREGALGGWVGGWVGIWVAGCATLQWQFGSRRAARACQRCSALH
jgi:U3 small nucleolar RNA-associated protein 21